MGGSSKQIIALLLCLRAVPDIALGQIRDGLLGHTWGTSVAAAVEPLRLHSPQVSDNCILYAAGIDQIGGANIEQCSVEFVDGRLAGVIVTTRGAMNSERLLAVLQEGYGDGTRRNPRAWTWRVGETHVAYDLDSFGDAYAYWYSMRLHK